MWACVCVSKSVFQVNLSQMILTASCRPDSVGVLSMSASNTSSAPVLTYNITNRKREKCLGEKRFIIDGDGDDYHYYYYQTWSFLYLPLCGSSLRACLVGGLFCSLSGYNLFMEFLATQNSHIWEKAATVCLFKIDLIGIKSCLPCVYDLCLPFSLVHGSGLERQRNRDLIRFHW